MSHAAPPEGPPQEVIESTINGTEDWMLILETWVDEHTSGSRLRTWLERRERSETAKMRVQAHTVASRYEEITDSKTVASLRAQASELRSMAYRARDRRRYNIRPVEIRTNEGGEAVVLMPVAFFDKPEALAQSLRLRTYLSQMDVE